MGDMDDIIEAFNEKTKNIANEAAERASKPLIDKINDLEVSNQELVNSNQELVNSNQELVKEVELLRNKKNIPVQLFLNIKKNNPNLSDEEALNLAKQQIDNLGELS